MSQLLQNAAAGTVLILVTALLRLALKKRLPPEVWLALWAVCLFRLLTPAAPESLLSVYALPRQLAAVPSVSASAPSVSAPAPAPPPSPVPGGAAALPGAVPSNPTSGGAGSAPVQTAPAGPTLNLGRLLAAVWLLGAAVTALRFVLNWRRTRRAVSCAVLLPPSDPRYAALPPGGRLREGAVKGAPLTFGVVRPTVVLPPDLSGAALACVLAHEGVHARRRDNLWHYAVALARIVFWWDPAVALMDRLLRRDIELSCDRASLNRLGPDRRREYAEILLTLSIPAEGPVFSQPFGQKQAEERIVAIMKHKKMTALGLALSILLVCGITAAFATEPMDDTDDPEPAETEIIENTPEPVETEPVEVEPKPTENMIRIPSTDDPQLLAKSLVEEFAAALGIEAEFIPVGSEAHLGCTHPEVKQGTSCHLIMRCAMDETMHTEFGIRGNVCPDCGREVYYGENVEPERQKPHDFGPMSCTVADHTSTDFSQHSDTFSRQCVDCLYTDKSVVIPAGCEEGFCKWLSDVGTTPNPDSTDPADWLHVPSQQEVLRDGYPVNKNGETYGPAMPVNDWESPDLELAKNQNGLAGYVRDSEFPGASVRNPEEAMAYMDHLADWESHTDADHYVNMYLHDGVTVIGRFRIGGQCLCGL